MLFALSTVKFTWKFMKMNMRAYLLWFFKIFKFFGIFFFTIFHDFFWGFVEFRPFWPVFSWDPFDEKFLRCFILFCRVCRVTLEGPNALLGFTPLKYISPLKRIQANFKNGFNNEIGFGHFKLEFLNQTNDKSFEFIAPISAMIQLIYVNTTFEWSFLLQGLELIQEVCYWDRYDLLFLVIFANIALIIIIQNENLLRMM